MYRVFAFLLVFFLAAPASAATRPLDLWEVTLRPDIIEDHYTTLAGQSTDRRPPKRPPGPSAFFANLAQVYVLTIAAVALAHRLPGPRRQAAVAAVARPRIR